MITNNHIQYSVAHKPVQALFSCCIQVAISMPRCTNGMSVIAILIVYPSIPAAPEAIPLEEMSEPVTEVLKPSKTNQEGAILDTLL